jgi:hypothetical protein
MDAWKLAEIGPREVGAVTWNGYWRQWELTLAVEFESADWMPWAVTQVDCDEHGFPVDGARERRHCTAWDAKRNRVRDPISL